MPHIFSDVTPVHSPFTDSLSVHEQAVVFYRLPHAKTMKRLVQHTSPRRFNSLRELPETRGYVVMPFGITPECPLVFIEPDIAEEVPLEEPQPYAPEAHKESDEAQQRLNYHTAFTSSHGRLTRGELKKVVLSRRLHTSLAASSDKADSEPANLWRKGYEYFLRACHNRPNSYVAFWWTPFTGAWLIATPEPLLERHEDHWGTVALAGTLPWQENIAPQWNEKNREEQAIVRRFITAQLEDVATDLQLSETYSLHTGNIQHLCTDFRFQLNAHQDICNILMRLHPTPAVCGLPREDARQAILCDETSPRRYYAGFSGPLHLMNETHLFVSLRCMEFTPDTATLYAGGGLMPESDETEEWEETRRKMQTMWQLL